MKHTKKEIITLGIVMLTASAFCQSVNWKADTGKATIKIVTSGPFGEVDGSLAGLKATIVFDDQKPASGSIKATVNPATINTGVSLRNTHLREKEEFFNTATYPLISFASTQIQKTDSGYAVTGNLSIKTVSKPITIPFTFEKTSTGATFKGHFTMDALDYTVGKSSKSVAVYIVVPVTK
jgi:polyisoprenoid-binding protein YceI